MMIQVDGDDIEEEDEIIVFKRKSDNRYLGLDMNGLGPYITISR